MVSISGIRGIVGESLTPDIIVNYSAAFAQYCQRGPIVIGRDGRLTGKIIGNIVSSTLLSMGCDVIALGIVPTPTIQIAVEKLNAAGGISITASHNPMQWNGLKFLSNTGMFLDLQEFSQFFDITKSKHFQYVKWDTLGKHVFDESFIKKHIDMVVGLPYVQTEQIRKRKFRVVVDCINAAGGVIVPQLLRELGCYVVEMNCDVGGVFARNPEPLPEHLGEVCDRVRKEKADLGIVVDPDVDRLVIVTEKGAPFGEEYTIASITKLILEKNKNWITAKRKPLVVVNLSTTKAVDAIAQSYGAQVVRTPVGEINVARKMKECGAVIGGEGSGGVILPDVHYGRDAIVGIGLFLQMLTDHGGTVSEFKASLPQFSMIKTKVELENHDAESILKLIQERHSRNGDINTDDGLRIDFKGSWVHMRKSNTEPIIRIIAEASTPEQAQSLIDKFKNDITKLGERL